MKLLFLAAIITILSSCGSNNEELIVGTWNEVETGKSVSIYNADKTYHIDFEDESTEDGVWRVDGSTLYNTEKGDDEELSVELTTLDDKTMVQNIGGMFQTTYARAD